MPIQNQAQIIPTPKERFVKSPHAKNHADLVTTERFIAATDAAMLSFVLQTLPESTDPVESAAQYQRLLGARQFLKLLNAIADPPRPVTRQLPGDNLTNT